MSLSLLIAPDFSPDRFAGWHILNTLLQRRSGSDIHLLTPASAHEQAQLVAQGKVDLIYANPFDAAQLIFKQGFSAVAAPIGKSDEMVIVAGAQSPAGRVEDLRPGARIALTDNKDVKLIGLRLIEPADLTESDVQWVPVDSYQAAARLALRGEVDAAFLLAESFQCLSRITRAQLKVLIESRLADITHVVLAHERVPAATLATLRDALLGLSGSEDGRAVLAELGMPEGFRAMSGEDVEFMIDLMETLLD